MMLLHTTILLVCAFGVVDGLEEYQTLLLQKEMQMHRQELLNNGSRQELLNNGRCGPRGPLAWPGESCGDGRKCRHYPRSGCNWKNRKTDPNDCGICWPG